MSVGVLDQSNSFARATSSGGYVSGEIPSLNGLRAVAVGIVFFGHVLPQPFPGEFGVTVFFFLSGYLITTLMRMEFGRHGTISLRAFYLRRVLRIFPPFYLVMISATTLATLGTLGPVHLSAGALITEVFYMTNYYIVSGEWWPGSPYGGAPGTGVYWSLAVEEHFYLFFPLLYLLLQRTLRSRLNQALVLLGICGVVLAWRCILVFVLHSAYNRTYMTTDARIDSILFGCVLAVLGNPILDRTRFSKGTWLYVWLPLGIAGLLLGFAIRNLAFHESFRNTLQGICLVPIFVVAMRRPDLWLMRPLNWAWVSFLGVMSYSIYLLHETVLNAVAINLQVSTRVTAVLAAIITVALAYGIHMLVEKPLIRWRRSLSRVDRGQHSVPATTTIAVPVRG